MRYSRFRSAMLGIEPQKRNRTTNSKNKVTKSKKESRPVTKREEEDEERDDPVKPEPGYQGQSTFSDYQARLANMRVKHEMAQQQQQQQQQHHHHYQTTHFNSPSPAGAESLRLLTPCSDDMLSVPHNIQFSPPPALLAGFDSMPSEPCTHGHEDHDVGNDPVSWAASPIFQPFDYHLNTYAIPDMPLFQRPDTSGNDMMSGHIEVKNEQWDGTRR